jgi:P27 family predicted phage terminase small subunit
MPKGEPLKPDWLEGDASEAWDVLAEMLGNLGVIGETDANIMARYCETLRIWHHVRVLCDGGKKIYKRDGDTVEEMPWITRFQRLGEQLRHMERELGLTPSARASLRTDSGDAPKKNEQSESERRFAKLVS